MKKHKQLIILLLSVALLLGSCTKSDSKKSTSAGVAAQGGNVQLVWVTDAVMLQKDKEVYKQFNTLLVKKGNNFTVTFKGVEGEDYAPTIAKMKNAGQQVDLLFSDVGYSDDQSRDSAYSSYYNCVKNGDYLSLDEDLKTAQGQKLYNAYDKKMWDGAKVKGKIYGVSGAIDVGTSFTWQFNKALLQKYHLDLSKIPTDLGKIADVLKTVYQGEKSDPGFATIFMPNPADAIEPFYDTLTSCVGVSLADSSAKAVNLYAQSSTVQYIETLKQFSEEGYLKNDIHTVKSFFMTPGGHNIGNEAEENSVEIPSAGQTISIPTVYRTVNDPTIRSKNLRFAYTGVASWSKYKQQAFSLLALVNTDADLSNLLAFGIQNQTYSFKDGYAQIDENNPNCPNLLTMTCFGNPLINYPCQRVGIYKGVDYRSALQKAKESPILGFYFDDSEVKKEVAATDAVLQKYSDQIWSGSEPNADATIRQMQSELSAAGIDKVVKEANRQIAAWKKTR